MLTNIVTPDGGQYGFTFEPTPLKPSDTTGRIQEITLPSGGSVQYSYQNGNNGLNCWYLTVPMLQVTVNDNNGNQGIYTYQSSLSTTQSSGCHCLPPNFTVTKTDPAQNQTVFTFSGEFQTQVVAYQGGCPTTITGCNGGGTLLRTAVTCYNGKNSSAAGCITLTQYPSQGSGLTPIPITQTDVYTSLNGGSYSLVETVLDTYGNVTTVRNYGFGASFPPSGTPVSETDTTYANVGGVTCGTASAYIYNRPCKVTTYSAGSMVQQVSYTYNTGGHPTQTSTFVASGSANLVSNATYNTNGTLSSVTDVNSNTTTNYSYTGTGGCSSPMLPLLSTSSTVTGSGLPSGGLTAYTLWNCTGGVLTSSTDYNGITNATNYSYVNQNGTADPYWRALSVTDPLNNTTWTMYSPGGTLPVTIETVLANSSTSASDTLTTYDGLARLILQQTRQAPKPATNWTEFDTVVTGYDLLGRVTSVGMPCTSTASSPCASSTTTTTYDALNRPLQITDGATGYTKNNYSPTSSSSGDVLVTVGPAPSGENLKKKQLEYDGLGRLTSVCELTGSANGGGTCGQKLPKWATGLHILTTA